MEQSSKSTSTPMSPPDAPPTASSSPSVTIRAPSACPFSGVPIDPAMWASFQAKLAINDHHHHHYQVIGKSKAARKTEEDIRAIVQQAEDADQSEDDDEGQNSLSSGSKLPQRRFLRRSITNNYRVRVVNETTQRSKDIVVDRNGHDSLFNAIYNHPSVKEAQVRKWGSEISSKVKSGQSEIQVKLVVGDDVFCRWFTVEELKQITTKKLYRMIEKYQSLQSIVIYLVCVSKDSAPQQVEEDQEKSALQVTAVPLENGSSFKGVEEQEPKEQAIAPSNLIGTATSNFHIRVVNDVTKRNKDMVLDISSQDSLFDAIYNHPSVKAAHVRKWGSEIAKQVKSGLSEIKVKVVAGEDSFCQWFTVDELRKTTIHQLYQMMENQSSLDSLMFCLVCIPTNVARDESEQTAGREEVSIRRVDASAVEEPLLQTAPGKPDHISLSGSITDAVEQPANQSPAREVPTSIHPVESQSCQPANAMKEVLPRSNLKQSTATSNFQIRVVNQTTKRSKDMVLDKTGKESLFDAIYNHSSVKDAHIRKWGSEIAKKVKSGQSEIRVKVAIGEDFFCQWFTVDELKDMTTQQLYQLIEYQRSSGSLVFNLVCVPTSESQRDLEGSLEQVTEATEAPKLTNKIVASAVEEPLQQPSTEERTTLGHETDYGEDLGKHSRKAIAIPEAHNEAPQTETLPKQLFAGSSYVRSASTSTFRIRVINETTKRSKDLVLDKEGSDTLFNGIYNHPSVKEAHVRKWGSEIAKEVKSGQSEIKVRVAAGEDVFCCWFTVDELKETTIQQLFQKIEDECLDSLVFNLVCVSTNKSKDSVFEPPTSSADATKSMTEKVLASTVDNPLKQPAAATQSPTIECTKEPLKQYTGLGMKQQVDLDESLEAGTVPKEPLAASSFLNSPTIGNFRIHIINETTKRSKDMVLDSNSKDSLFDAIYNHISVKEAHIRKWGSEIAKEVKSGRSEIRVKVVAGEDVLCLCFTVDELKHTTIQQLHHMIKDEHNMDSLIFNLICAPTPSTNAGRGEAPTNPLAETRAPDGAAKEAVDDQQKHPKTKEVAALAEHGEPSEASNEQEKAITLPGLMRRATTSNFRVHVVNQTTKRSKDMVLDKEGSDSVFDAIYNHSGVKEAHVRKWGSEIAKEVKSGEAEIQVKVVFGENASCRWFTVDELKETTIRQLFEMNEDPESNDSLVFNLVCVPKCSDNLGSSSGEAARESVDVSATPSTEGRRQSMRFASLRRQSTLNSDVVSEEGTSSPFDESVSICANEGAIKVLRTLSVATSSHVDSTMSDPSMSVSMMDVDLPAQKLHNLAPSQDQIKSTLGVRVINQTTQRHKDLVVHISDTNTVFDMVYDHPGVKSAHVRKWGGPIAKAVKNGKSEIKFSVWDDDTQKPWRVFSIDELKSTTTRQLYELVSESSNWIKIYLQCVSTVDDSNSNNPNQETLGSTGGAATSTTSLTPKTGDSYSVISKTNTEPLPSSGKKKDESRGKTTAEHKVMPVVPIGPKRQASLHLGKTGRPQHAARPRRQASLRLEKHGRPQFSIETSDPAPQEKEPVPAVKKPRPNHMKWLAAHMPRNGSCPTMKQMVTMSQNGALQRGVGSHDRLEGFPPTRSQTLACSKSDSSNSGLLREALKASTGLKAKEQSVLHHSLAGSKNESSKNATWQSTKTDGHQGKLVTNKLLSRLNKSAPAPIKPPGLAHMSEKDEVPSNPPSCLTQTTSRSKPQNATKESFATDSDEAMVFDTQIPGSLDDSRQSLPCKTSAKRSRRRRSKKSSINRASSLDEVPPVDEPLIKPTLKRTGSDPLSLGAINVKANEEKKQKIKEFMRLLRAKKLPEFQSQRSLGKKKRSSDNISGLDDSQQSVPSVVQMGEQSERLRPSLSGLTLNGQESACGRRQKRTSTTSISSNCSSVQTPQDKINRFLRLNPSQPKSTAKTNDKIARFLTLQKSGTSENEETSTRRVSWCEPDDMDRSVSLSTRKSLQNQYGLGRAPLIDMPPLKEISVIANDDHEPSAPVSMPGVALSPFLVKEVFPYHVVMDDDFRIVQIGNNLEMLIQESGLVGRFVSDIMTVTSPIPIFGSWDWNILEKMKDKTIFLESVLSPAMEEKVKLKGTLIEVSKSPKQVMLALFPNVKNLAELEEANLSMADLPLHSCQREAVLLGEHSKSEVNLTNHLDKLHRDLIDSMEQQIKDRTEELAAANRQLETANSRLAIQSARQLEHFACMSHEIRTPLNCIVGMSSLLLDDADEMDPMHSDSIKMINTSGDLLKAVVDDVLDYAKLESGSFEVDIKESDLQHTLNSVAHSISQKVQDKNIRLRLDYSPFLPETVETDSRRLQQVLFNLLGNAGKFSKRNSVIDLTVSVVPVALTDVDPDETSKGEVIRFSVKDYGKGIEEKDFRTIFEPFSQASKETQNVYGGTGLGLSITSKLVHRLGGTVALQSEYGKYTDFTVDLPLRGKEVNVPKLQKRLRNTTLVLVEPPTTYDYSFTEYAIKPEPSPFQAAVAQAYKLNVMRCRTMDEVLVRIEKERLVDPGKHFAFLVHEDLYQFGLFDRLDKLVCRLNYTLMTFGPKYSVEMTKDRHFKSLAGVFPSAMLEKIVDTMERRKLEKMFSNRTLSKLMSPEAADEVAQEVAGEHDDTSSIESDESEADESEADESLEPGNGPVHGGATAPASGLFAGLQGTEPGSNHFEEGLFACLDNPLFACLDNPRNNGVNRENGVHAKREAGSDAGIPKAGSLFSIATNTVSNASMVTVAHTKAGSETSAEPSRKNAIAKQHAHSATRQTLKVLYAEDNKINQKVLSRVLTRVGITNLTIVDNGKEAVDITERQKFDIIFMDVQMPIMGGMEATKLIMERNPSERVVFVTAHALDEFKAQADAVGATSFLSKPFRPADIESLLEELGYSDCPPDSESNSQGGTVSSKQPQGAAGNIGASFSMAKKIASTIGVLQKKSADEPVNPTSPVSPTPKVTEKPPSKELNHSAERQGLKVLYAEDNKINQKVLTRVLTRSGITNLTIVDNGKKAVDITETQKFDIIFMDVQMPIMGGMEATKLIMDRNPSEKVVFVTAHALDEFKTQADAVGATSFLSKPFRPDDIEKLLEDLGYSKSAPADKSNGASGTPQNNKVGGPGSKSGGLFSTLEKNDPPTMPMPQKESTAPTKPQQEVVPHVSPAKKATGKQHNHSAARQGLKVLYAEDNKVNQKVLSRVLARSGVTNLTIVDDGQKAVDVSKEEKFDIIFMDIQMPIMGGMEATKLIIERNPSEKIIFVTAHALDEFKAQAKAVGATSFISKPFRLDDIENLFKELGY